MENNIILSTDSYKVTHHNQYPVGTEVVYSYFESRNGAKFKSTVFFGLQYVLKKFLVGQVVTQEKIDAAEKVFNCHFADGKSFNRKGWEYILNVHDGRLPVRIKAVKEGSVIPVSNVMMTIENTDPECFWLTNYLETLLSQVWYPSTVCTLSREVKKMIKVYLDDTLSDDSMIDFMLHDFGFRGASSFESSAIGGMAHLVNFVGTDTLSAITAAQEYYGANLDSLAYSVPATEHSVMTSLGRACEETMVKNLLEKHPTGILSVVADSYDIYNFVENFVCKKYKDKILSRDGIFVVRPDSVTKKHPTPESEMIWILEKLWKTIGGKVNKRGFREINPKVKVLWGDGLDIEGIEKILKQMKKTGYAISNVATFGMGGGLLQKVNRDTQRFAFKCSSQTRNKKMYKIFKDPIDKSKASKAGRLKLVSGGTSPYTIEGEPCSKDLLRTVFEDGKLIEEVAFSDVRGTAKI